MTHPPRTCVCGQPLRNNAAFCRDCERWARRRLADQTAYRDELNTELTKQARKQAPNNGGRTDEQPLVFSPPAGVLMRQQIRWLARWWQTVHDAVPAVSGPICEACRHTSCRTIPHTWMPNGSVTGVATYLADHLPTIRQHPDGARFITSLRSLTGRIVRLIDSLETRTRILVGPCPQLLPVADNPNALEPCPGQVEAIVPADETIPAVMRCQACRTEWPAAQWNRAGARITARATQIANQKRLAEAITGGAA